MTINWDQFVDRAQKVIDLLVKMEAHAICIIGLGCLLVVHGEKEIGNQLLILGAGIFKGNR